MKLYRSQLDQLISNQLFEISIEDLDLDSFQVVNDQIFSTVTVEFASSGYRIYGDIKCKTLEACDRCLNSYEHKKKNADRDICMRYSYQGPKKVNWTTQLWVSTATSRWMITVLLPCDSQADEDPMATAG